MEERKIAAIVLSIIVLIVIFFTLILPKIRYRNTQTLSFKGCKIKYRYFDHDFDTDVYRTAKNKLALCLCSTYSKKPDTAVAKEIIKIYHHYGNHYGYDSVSFDKIKNVDSMIKNRKTIFDTIILVD